MKLEIGLFPCEVASTQPRVIFFRSRFSSNMSNSVCWWVGHTRRMQDLVKFKIGLLLSEVGRIKLGVNIVGEEVLSRLGDHVKGIQELVKLKMGLLLSEVVSTNPRGMLLSNHVYVW